MAVHQAPAAQGGVQTVAADAEAARQPASDRAPDWVAAGTPEPLRSALTGTLGADRVLTRALDLIRYASDASPYRQIPQAVAVPRDVGDVVRLLGFARAHRLPLTFRAGGTSLNGQAQSDALLVDVRRHWQSVQVLDGGRLVKVAPGAVLGYVNRLLARHGRKLGPDPASADVACAGGVIANNSGGMRCGVVADSYRTVRSMTFVLANGAVIDTSAPDAEQRFAAAAPALARGLAQIRDRIRADAPLAERIARKFQIKNTTGYRLCAFLDADTPLEIFRRLVVGSEGTLAFIAEAVFETLPWSRHASAGLLLFDDVSAAAAAVGPLSATGASAIELMVATTLIAAAYNMPGTPAAWKQLSAESAALLVEYRTAEPAELDEPERAAIAAMAQARGLGQPPRFSRDPAEIAMLWRVREGMQGLLAAVRPPGVQLIFEDVCVPPARLAAATEDLRGLLGRHGFLPGVAGHASAGNLHFVLTPNFGEPADLDRYAAFVEDLVALIVDRYDGSLKAEHGTGVNMAPFVAREWGPEATELMWEIKRLADPDGILAPGVVLNRDPRVHLRNLKSTPEIDAVVTKCIECGFCEPVCPSRNVTTTPRQRIVVRREMARQPDGSALAVALAREYEYDGVQTCATDGMCARACPVAIDAGALTKALRGSERGQRSQRWGQTLARRYGVVERVARAGVALGASAARAVGDDAVADATQALGRVLGDEGMPRWTASMPAPAPHRLPFTVREGAAAVYVPACLNRVLGHPRSRSPHPSVPEALVALSARAGLPLWIPDDVRGHCCATPWSSKGYRSGQEVMGGRSAAALARWSDGGRLPVVTDASSCALGWRNDTPRASTGGGEVEVLDAVEWVHDRLLAALKIRRRTGTALVHLTCASAHLGAAAKLITIAEQVADEVVVPAAGGCCGMAGDRGWLHPELPASALEGAVRELDGRRFDACLSSNRTCEVALEQVTGRPFESFVLAVEEATRQ